MAPFAIALFGSMRVLRHDQPVERFGYEKVRALLACLALQRDQPWRREALAELLWPNRPGQEARMNLRHALSTLRHVIDDTSDPALILTTRDRLQLNPDVPISIDTLQFAQLRSTVLADHPDGGLCPACALRLNHAVELYQGDLLEQLQIDDASDFAEWLMPRREQLHQQMLELLTRLCHYHEQRGEASEVERYAWRRIVLEPWDEEAYRMLMVILAHSGRRAAALAQYERLCHILNTELGIEPLEETRALAGSLRQGHHQPGTAEHARELRSPVQPLGPIYLPPHLPAPSSSLIGRTSELALLRTIMHSQQRILTLCGPPGIGKTRLALALAADLAILPRFADGIWYVPLASVKDPAQVPAAIAQALGLPDPREQNYLAQLTGFFHQRQSLLLLDNLEQVAEAGPRLAELLSATAHLALLVTSRVVLHIQGEYVYPVPPLALPAAHADPAQILAAPAVQLLTARAALHGTRFGLDQASELAAICRQLDGLPLAIELAAARTHILAPATLLTRLREQSTAGLDLLADPSYHAVQHQRTLRDSITWSYNLLLPNEAALLRWLVVFVGDFTLDAAERTWTAAGKPAPAVIDLFSALLDKSMVARMPGREQSPRFMLLELIREYAHERLIEAGEEYHARLSHARYYAQLGEELETGIVDSRQITTLDHLAIERPNITAALNWCLSRAEQTPPDPIAAELALRLGRGLSWYWLYRDGAHEGRQWLARTLAAAPNAAPLVRVRALGAAGGLEAVGGDLGQAEALLREEYQLGQRLEYAPGCFHACWMLSLVAWQSGQLTEAASLADRAASLTAQLRPYHHAVALFQQGRVAASSGAHEQGFVWLLEALRHIRLLGCRWTEGDILINLGIAAECIGDLHQASRYYQECLDCWQAVGSTQWAHGALMNLITVEQIAGHYREVERLAEQLLAIWHDLGDAHAVGMAQATMARYYIERGDYVHATDSADRALLAGQSLATPDLCAQALLASGTALLAQNRRDAAWALLDQLFPTTRASGDRSTLISTLSLAAQIAARTGQHALASQYLAEQASLVAQINRADEQAVLLFDQGCAALLSGALAQAEQLLDAAAAAYGHMQAPAYAARALSYLASARALSGNYRQAIQTWAAAETARATCGAPIWPLDQAFQEQLQRQARAELGEQAYTDACNAGHQAGWLLP